MNRYTAQNPRFMMELCSAEVFCYREGHEIVSTDNLVDMLDWALERVRFLDHCLKFHKEGKD